MITARIHDHRGRATEHVTSPASYAKLLRDHLTAAETAGMAREFWALNLDEVTRLVEQHPRLRQVLGAAQEALDATPGQDEPVRAMGEV